MYNEAFDYGSTTLLGFTDNATPLFDARYDSRHIGTPVSIYTHLPNGEESLGIQGREAFNIDMQIGVGFTSLIDVNNAEYTISIANLEGPSISEATVFLIDNQLEKITNLSEENYVFISNSGIFNNRFTLLFKDRNMLETSENVLESISIYPNPTSNFINIFSPIEAINRVTITDTNGRLILDQSFNATNNHSVDMSAISSALYFVHAHSENGTYTKKVFKN